MEFPNGGIAYVVGNLIEQGTGTENQHLIAIGAEGYVWPRNEICLVNNTLVDRMPAGGVFLRSAPGIGMIYAVNNLLVGPSQLESSGPGEYHNNFTVGLRDFAQSETHDFRLKEGSPLAGRSTIPAIRNGQHMQPRREYVHPRGTRPVDGTKHNPGAMQSMASIPST